MRGEQRRRLEDFASRPSEAAVFTDIDGVLAPIVPTPDMSEVPEDLRDLLRRISERYLLVAGVSGRKTEEALELVGLEGLVYYGNHGFEILRDGEVEVAPEALPFVERIQELERRAREELEPLGAFVEEKGITASVHYRNAPPEVGERAVALARAAGEELGLRITVGRGVVEARPPVEADKGTAVRRLVEEYGPRKAMFVGDDTTDLDAFRELGRLREAGTLDDIVRVGVASDEGPQEIVTEADVMVESVESVPEVFQALLEG